MKKIKSFFVDYYVELTQKVSWPSGDELQSQTVTVLIASLMIALVIMMMDFASNYSLKFIYELFV